MPLPKLTQREDLTTFGDRLSSEAIKLFGSLNKLSAKLGVDYSVLHRWVKNKGNPTIEQLVSLQSLGFNLNYLINGDKDKETKHDKNYLEENTIAIPKFTSPVRGGTWNMVENDNCSTIYIPAWQVKGMKKPAVVDVIGMSMAPEIEFKDTVIFDMQFEVKDKDIIICTYNNDTMIKQYRNRKEKITLESYNPEFPPIEVKNEITIHGVVKKVIHNVDKKRRVV